MINWLKSLFKEYHHFEVGDRVIQNVEKWENPKVYDILEVGEHNYRVVDNRGYECPDRKPDYYVTTEPFWYIDRNFRISNPNPKNKID